MLANNINSREVESLPLVLHVALSSVYSPKAARPVRSSVFRPVQGSTKITRSSVFRPVQESPKVAHSSVFGPVQGNTKVVADSSFQPVQGTPQATPGSDFQPVQGGPEPGPSFQPVQGPVPEKVNVGVQFSGTCHNLLQSVRQDNQEL